MAAINRCLIPIIDWRRTPYCTVHTIPTVNCTVKCQLHTAVSVLMIRNTFSAKPVVAMGGLKTMVGMTTADAMDRHGRFQTVLGWRWPFPAGVM